MNALVWHSAALVLGTATIALVLIMGHATLRSLAIALGAGTAVVVAMLAISSTGVLTERASGAMTPTISGTREALPPSRSIRFSGIGWEVGARPVVVGTEFGLEVVATGVETPADAVRVRDLGVGFGEGGLFGGPQPLTAGLSLPRSERLL